MSDRPGFSRYNVVPSPQFRAQAAAMGAEEQRTLAQIMRHLARSPYESGEEVTVYPSRDDDLPNAYTAALHNVLVAHQVMVDMPVVKLLYVLWV